MRIDFTRGNFRTWFIGVLATGFFGFAAGSAALYPERFLEGDSPGTRVMAWLCTLLFLIPFVLLVLGSGRLLRRRGLTIDAAGIEPIRWSELIAVGVAYKVNPVPRVAGMIMRRQGYVLELFPAAGALLDGRLAGLTPDSEEPPRPGLPAERYRLPLPDFDTVPAQIERAVTTYAPHLWLGTYQREWRPIG